MKIYITDDEPVPTRILRLTLEREGFEVESFPNGAKVLERIREQAPDALVTDIEMPVMTGEELCKQIAEEMPDRSFPIFVVTSLTERVHREWSADLPDLNFVEKPVSMRRLVSQLRNALEPSTGRQSHGG
jgi:DNA-binding response OmpR family regulator